MKSFLIAGTYGKIKPLVLAVLRDRSSRVLYGRTEPERPSPQNWLPVKHMWDCAAAEPAAGSCPTGICFTGSRLCATPQAFAFIWVRS
jgi:hypothetical protein